MKASRLIFFQSSFIKPIMRLFISSILISLSLAVSAQCVNCNSLEEALKDPKKVKSLKVNPWQHGITMEELPASIGELENLEVLFLTGHAFHSIPPEIGKLKKLKELGFAETELIDLPDELFELRQLKELILLNTTLSEEYKEKIKPLLKEKLPKTKVFIN